MTFFSTPILLALKNVTISLALNISLFLLVSSNVITVVFASYKMKISRNLTKASSFRR